MSVRDNLGNLSRSKVADIVEGSAFGSLALSVLFLALKGIAVAVGVVGILTVGPFITASIGLFITFLSLLVFSLVLDYETIIESMLEDNEPVEVEEEGEVREDPARQTRNR